MSTALASVCEFVCVYNVHVRVGDVCLSVSRSALINRLGTRPHVFVCT